MTILNGKDTSVFAKMGSKVILARVTGGRRVEGKFRARLIKGREVWMGSRSARQKVPVNKATRNEV